MKIVALTPPGRFPTIVPDPGSWWSAVARLGRHELIRYNANYHWWRAVCSPGAKAALLRPYPFAQRVRQRLEWRASGLDICGQALRAGHALDALCSEAAYESAQAYIDALAPLAEWLETFNRIQTELEFSVNYGVRVVGLDYANSAELADYAARPTTLSFLIDAALADCPEDIDLLAVGVISPQDLLTAMIAVQSLRRRMPSLHACLVDHGYENFSLHPHIPKLRATGALERIFDTIIVSKDEREALVPWLVAAVEAKASPKGYLTHQEQGPTEAAVPGPYIAPPPMPSFSPTPVFWTRLSERRCYWSRCTFCVQNAKYDNPRPPSRAEIEPTLDRLEALLRVGYRVFVFSDEAVPPAFLSLLCRGILDRGLSFDWACRCKLEYAHTPELFEQMRAAGCYEVLFGLESISPRIQKLMDKFVPGLDGPRVRDILRSADRAGIAVHVNLIAGFPGDTPQEAAESVDFTIETLRDLDGATFILNQFDLFPETPIYADPRSFGIASVVGKGDMPMNYRYELVPELQPDGEAIAQLIPSLQTRLLIELGWDGLSHGPGPQTAWALYFLSGHGSLLKRRRRDNPFANPLRQPLHAVSS